MKICLPCPGLEHIQRGFETYTRDLFGALQGNCEVHLVKSSGRRETRVHVVPTLRRTSRLFGLFPRRWQTDYRRLQVECVLFALGMIPLLRREKFDVIHFSEVPLGSVLLWLRQRFGFRYRLLCSNGAPYPPWDCAPFDGVHQVSPAHHQDCLLFGIPADRQCLVPYGFNPTPFAKPAGFDVAGARRNLAIPEDAFVVLSLAALNKTHKRIDWLIEEFSKMADKHRGYLLLVGNRESETEELRMLAELRLKPGTWCMTQVSFNEVPELLWMADVMVQCSLDEGFGRTLVEAMLAGTPLLSHPHATARFLIDSPESFVDLTSPGDLKKTLESLEQDADRSSEMISRNYSKALDFSWDNLRGLYIDMYRLVAENRDPALDHQADSEEIRTPSPDSRIQQ
jgi:glycosyltransferase involved in cell wall biosynthesis